MSKLNKAFDKAKEIAQQNKNENGQMRFTYTQCLGFLYLQGVLEDGEVSSVENYLSSKNTDIDIIGNLLEANEIIGIN